MQSTQILELNIDLKSLFILIFDETPPHLPASQMAGSGKLRELRRRLAKN